MEASIEECRLGKAILGDDYNEKQIKEWYDDEAQGYAKIVPESHKDSFDEYENLTQRYLYRYILNRQFDNAMVYGGVWNRNTTNT